MQKILSIKNRKYFESQFFKDVDLQRFKQFCEDTSNKILNKKNNSVRQVIKEAVFEMITHTKTTTNIGTNIFFPLRPNFPKNIEYSNEDLEQIKIKFFNQTGSYIHSFSNYLLFKNCDKKLLEILVIKLTLCAFRSMVEDSFEIVAHGTDNHSIPTKELLPDSIKKLNFNIGKTFKKITGMTTKFAQEVVNLAIVLHDIGYQNCCHGKVHHSLDGAILFTQLLEQNLIEVLHSTSLSYTQSKAITGVIKQSILYHNADKVSSTLDINYELDTNVGKLLSERPITENQKIFLSIRGIAIHQQNKLGRLTDNVYGRQIQFKLPVLLTAEFKKSLGALSLALPVFQTSLNPNQQNQFERFGEFSLAVTKLLDNIHFTNRKHIFHQFPEFDDMLNKYFSILKKETSGHEKEHDRKLLLRSTKADIEQIELILQHTDSKEDQQKIINKLHSKKIVQSLFENHITLDQSKYFLGMHPFKSTKIEVNSKNKSTSIIKIICEQNDHYNLYKKVNITEDGHDTSLADIYPFRIFLAMKKIVSPIEIYFKTKTGQLTLYKSNQDNI
ncbi:MAG: hypothetical protein CMP39_05525 [Rickettsiales bacterium]|nr:hypothetical protein [Rickettsiales bacterium]